MSGAQKRISAAVIFAAALICVALFLRADNSTPSQAQVVAIVSAAPERNVIAVEDQNGDGVPDWQEALQVTEALAITGEADEHYKAPETLTEQFALEFFQDMVRAENYGAFGDSPDELVASAASTLAGSATDELFAIEDITVTTNTSKETLAVYGEQMAHILFTYSEETAENEADILLQALRNQNKEDLKKLDKKIITYGQYVEETKKVLVPRNLTREHLNVLNSYQALLSDIIAMRNAFDDPMLTLLRMKRYQEDAQGLYASLNILYQKLIDQGATWEPGSAAYSLMQEGN